MTLFTLAQIIAKLKYDYDLFEDNFVDLDTELVGYINEAIDDCETIIHTLYEDYFLSDATLTMVQGQKDISLPSDIYGQKIRGLLYNDGADKYLVGKIKKISSLLDVDSQDRYKYLVTNTTSSGVKLRIEPASRVSSASYLTVFYIRNAKRLSSVSDSCDIPEGINYIYAHVKRNLARKEKIVFDLAAADKEVQDQENKLNTTLSEMTVDESSNEMVRDLSFYQEFDIDDRF